MIVNFVIPETINVPMGGYKVVYQYAKKMLEEGNEVHIFYIVNLTGFRLIKDKINSYIRFNKFRRVSWFDLSGVHLHFNISYRKFLEIKLKGVCIATQWTTADVVWKCNLPNDRKFYFIQGYEIFDPSATVKMIDDTWRLPLKKIVVSKWLYKKAVELGVGNNTTLVPNFVNDNDYFPDCEMKRNVVSFLWHKDPDKQSKMGIDICHKLYKVYPNLKFVTFGVGVPDKLKNIYTFNNADKETLRKIYSQSVVYFMPSKHEGWGLTGLEAMSCGAPVVSIDNGGIKEYAQNGVSAIITKNNEEEMIKAIIKVIDSKKIQTTLRNNGFKVVSRFSLDKSFYKFMDVLNNF